MMTYKDIDEVIFALLLMDGNETHSYLHSEEDYLDWKNLIVELVKVKNDIRWCGNYACCCHPETKILVLIEKEHIKNCLEDGWVGLTPSQDTLYECIKILMKNTDQSKTVFGNDGNSIRRK